MLSRLHHYGIHGIALSLIENYISNQYQIVTVDNDNHASDMLAVQHGVPQGSILGPLLVLICINDIIMILHGQKLIIYADDMNAPPENKSLKMRQTITSTNSLCV